jgi:hypothetical protein
MAQKTTIPQTIDNDVIREIAEHKYDLSGMRKEDLRSFFVAVSSYFVSQTKSPARVIDEMTEKYKSWYSNFSEGGSSITAEEFERFAGKAVPILEKILPLSAETVERIRKAQEIVLPGTIDKEVIREIAADAYPLEHMDKNVVKNFFLAVTAYYASQTHATQAEIGTMAGRNLRWFINVKNNATAVKPEHFVQFAQKAISAFEAPEIIAPQAIDKDIIYKIALGEYDLEGMSKATRRDFFLAAAAYYVDVTQARPYHIESMVGRTKNWYGNVKLGLTSITPGEFRNFAIQAFPVLEKRIQQTQEEIKKELEIVLQQPMNTEVIQAIANNQFALNKMDKETLRAFFVKAASYYMRQTKDSEFKVSHMLDKYNSWYRTVKIGDIVITPKEFEDFAQQALERLKRQPQQQTTKALAIDNTSWVIRSRSSPQKVVGPMGEGSGYVAAGPKTGKDR